MDRNVYCIKHAGAAMAAGGYILSTSFAVAMAVTFLTWSSQYTLITAVATAAISLATVLILNQHFLENRVAMLGGLAAGSLLFSSSPVLGIIATGLVAGALARWSWQPVGEVN